MKNITTIIFVFFLFIKLEKGYIAKNSCEYNLAKYI